MSVANRVHLIPILAVTAKSNAQMPPAGEAHTQASPDTLLAADAGVPLASSFRFIPRELAVKCRRLNVGLPDMIWFSDARDIIERDRELTRIFKRAARSRAAKPANDSFLHIATTIVSLEVLARDFSGWGKRFPTAKREAEKLLGGLRQVRHTWLMDLYLFSPLGVRRKLGDTLSYYPTETHT
jgi:hypothetical protein